jgi:hypothetical protein
VGLKVLSFNLEASKRKLWGAGELQECFFTQIIKLQLGFGKNLEFDLVILIYLRKRNFNSAQV